MKFINLALLIAIFVTCTEASPYCWIIGCNEATSTSLRVLKGRSSGRSSYSSRSSYTKSSYSRKTYTYKTPSKTYVYTYSKTKTPTSYSNSYYNSATRKTYQPLYSYYKPANYYNSLGFYSTVYLRVYYDGYGYNFYYGNYGYYEYSVHPSQGSSAVSFIFLLVCVCFCCVPCFCYHRMKQAAEEEEEIVTVIEYHPG